MSYSQTLNVWFIYLIDMGFMIILLMEEILHQLIGSLSHCLQGLCIPGGAGFLPSTVLCWCFFSASCINCRTIDNQLPSWQRFVYVVASKTRPFHKTKPKSTTYPDVSWLPWSRPTCQHFLVWLGTPSFTIIDRLGLATSSKYTLED